jgi:hypothetical protein
MKNTSRGINLHGGVEKIDPNISIPDTWAEHSNRNIQESQGKQSLWAIPGDSFFKREVARGVGSESGSSQFNLFSHFHHYTAETQRLPMGHFFQIMSSTPGMNFAP